MNSQAALAFRTFCSLFASPRPVSETSIDTDQKLIQEIAAAGATVEADWFSRLDENDRRAVRMVVLSTKPFSLSEVDVRDKVGFDNYFSFPTDEAAEQFAASLPQDVEVEVRSNVVGMRGTFDEELNQRALKAGGQTSDYLEFEGTATKIEATGADFEFPARLCAAKGAPDAKTLASSSPVFHVTEYEGEYSAFVGRLSSVFESKPESDLVEAINGAVWPSEFYTIVEKQAAALDLDSKDQYRGYAHFVGAHFPTTVRAIPEHRLEGDLGAALKEAISIEEFDGLRQFAEFFFNEYVEEAKTFKTTKVIALMTKGGQYNLETGTVVKDLGGGSYEVVSKDFGFGQKGTLSPGAIRSLKGEAYGEYGDYADNDYMGHEVEQDEEPEEEPGMEQPDEEEDAVSVDTGYFEMGRSAVIPPFEEEDDFPDYEEPAGERPIGEPSSADEQDDDDFMMEPDDDEDECYGYESTLALYGENPLKVQATFVRDMLAGRNEDFWKKVAEKLGWKVEGFQKALNRFNLNNLLGEMKVLKESFEFDALRCPECDYRTVEEDRKTCPSCGLDLISGTLEEKVMRVSKGLMNAFGKVGKPRRVCSSCGFGMPAYPGRYPNACPHCGKNLTESRLDERSRATNSIDKQRERIAIKTLRMPSAMAGVMGGQSKDEARAFLMGLGYSKAEIAKLEEVKSLSSMLSEMLKKNVELPEGRGATIFHFHAPRQAHAVISKYGGGNWSLEPTRDGSSVKLKHPADKKQQVFITNRIQAEPGFIGLTEDGVEEEVSPTPSEDSTTQLIVQEIANAVSEMLGMDILVEVDVVGGGVCKGYVEPTAALDLFAEALTHLPGATALEFEVEPNESTFYVEGLPKWFGSDVEGELVGTDKVREDSLFSPKVKTPSDTENPANRAAKAAKPLKSKDEPDKSAKEPVEIGRDSSGGRPVKEIPTPASGGPGTSGNDNYAKMKNGQPGSLFVTMGTGKADVGSEKGKGGMSPSTTPLSGAPPIKSFEAVCPSCEVGITESIQTEFDRLLEVSFKQFEKLLPPGWRVKERSGVEVAIETDGGKRVSSQSIINARNLAKVLGVAVDVSKPSDGDVVFALEALMESQLTEQDPVVQGGQGEEQPQAGVAVEPPPGGEATPSKSEPAEEPPKPTELEPTQKEPDQEKGGAGVVQCPACGAEIPKDVLKGMLGALLQQIATQMQQGATTPKPEEKPEEEPEEEPGEEEVEEPEQKAPEAPAEPKPAPTPAPAVPAAPATPPVEKPKESITEGIGIVTVLIPGIMAYKASVRNRLERNVYLPAGTYEILGADSKEYILRHGRDEFYVSVQEIKAAGRSIEVDIKPYQESLIMATGELAASIQVESHKIPAGVEVKVLAIEEKEATIEVGGKVVNVNSERVAVYPKGATLDDSLAALERGASLKETAALRLRGKANARRACVLETSASSNGKHIEVYFPTLTTFNQAKDVLSEVQGARWEDEQRVLVVEEEDKEQQRRLKGMAEELGGVVLSTSILEQLDTDVASEDAATVNGLFQDALEKIKMARRTLVDIQTGDMARAVAFLKAMGAKGTVVSAIEKASKAVEDHTTSITDLMTDLDKAHDTFMKAYPNAGNGEEAPPEEAPVEEPPPAEEPPAEPPPETPVEPAPANNDVPPPQEPAPAPPPAEGKESLPVTDRSVLIGELRRSGKWEAIKRMIVNHDFETFREVALALNPGRDAKTVMETYDLFQIEEVDLGKVIEAGVVNGANFQAKRNFNLRGVVYSASLMKEAGPAFVGGQTIRVKQVYRGDDGDVMVAIEQPVDAVIFAEDFLTALENGDVLPE